MVMRFWGKNSIFMNRKKKKSKKAKNLRIRKEFFLYFCSRF